MEKWLVVYDTPNDGRRHRLSTILDGYGDRVQWSVFEVRVEAGEMERVLRRLAAVMEADEDSVRLYPACEACARKVVCLGVGNEEPWWEPEVIIV